MKKPNVIFILSDQQRWDTLGCYGQSLEVTPNLDQLAREGVKFEKAFTCQPVCGPARASIQTGKYAAETGCYRNGIALPRDEKTIAHWFSEAGYELGYVGKWHLASTGGESNEDIGSPVDYRTAPVPLERRGGWKDYWLASDVLEFTSHGYNGHLFDAGMKRVEFEGYRVDALTDYALDFLRARRENPFFLFISYLEPHHQNDRERYEGPEGSKERFANFTVPGDLQGEQGDWQENYPDYLGSCARIDESVGRIRAELEKMGAADDTLLIYTSDHGSHFRTRNGEYKRSCHEASIRIPLLAYGPGFRGGRTISHLVSLIDLPPTLLRAAGLGVPEVMRGRPLQQLLKGEVEDWPEEVFLQISESQVGRAIRTRRWKYSVRAPEKDGVLDAGSSLYREDFLYDLEDDPYEKVNLVSDSAYGEIRGELKKRLTARMAAAGEEIPRIVPAGELEGLR